MPTSVIVRVFLNTDWREIELPNHETALRNLDLTNPRLLVKREYRDAAHGNSP